MPIHIILLILIKFSAQKEITDLKNKEQDLSNEMKSKMEVKYDYKKDIDDLEQTIAELKNRVSELENERDSLIKRRILS